jgi:hypothetical protein
MFRADAHTTPAQHTVFVPERIADFLHPATHGNILNGTGVRSMGNEEFREVSPQFSDSFRITLDYHILLHPQGAGGGDL